MAKVLLEVKPTTGDPVKNSDAVMPVQKTKLDTKFDIRDRLADLVAMGNNIKPDEKTAIYGALTSVYGQDKAQKILNHAYLFNSRPDMQNVPIEEKLRSFYTIGSNDPDVNEILSTTKNLGYGVVPGMRDSVSNSLAILQGRGVSAGGNNNSEVKKKIVFKTGG